MGYSPNIVFKGYEPWTCSNSNSSCVRLWMCAPQKEPKCVDDSELDLSREQIAFLKDVVHARRPLLVGAPSEQTHFPTLLEPKTLEVSDLKSVLYRHELQMR